MSKLPETRLASAVASNTVPLSPDEIADDVVERTFAAVICMHQSLGNPNDKVAAALCAFLNRLAHTWRSIRTLRDNRKADDVGFMIDAGALLRAMFDAYLQAHYIYHDPCQRLSRAELYYDYVPVERYRNMMKALKHSHPVSVRLRASAKRPAGEAALKADYDRLKGRYPRHRGAGVRDHWYEGNLADLAASIGKEDEYDVFLSQFHGCIHSSAQALHFGPPVTPPHVLSHATRLACRVASLLIAHHGFSLVGIDADVLKVFDGPD